MRFLQSEATDEESQKFFGSVSWANGTAGMVGLSGSSFLIERAQRLILLNIIAAIRFLRSVSPRTCVRLTES